DDEGVGPERAETICVLREAIGALVRMLAPFAPHTAEELWERLGESGGLAAAARPVVDAGGARGGGGGVPGQVNGKVRARLAASPDAAEAELEKLALADPAVLAHLGGKPVKKVVVAKGRLVSIVV